LVWDPASRGALLGICSIVGVYALMENKGKKVMTLAMIAAVGATMDSLSLMSGVSEDLDCQTSDRLLPWKAGFNMAIRNPLFGVGIGGYPKNLVAYAPDGNVGTEKEHMTAHSSWVLVLSEGGFPAILFFAGLWGYAIYCAWQMRHQYPEYLA